MLHREHPRLSFGRVDAIPGSYGVIPQEDVAFVTCRRSNGFTPDRPAIERSADYRFRPIGRDEPTSASGGGSGSAAGAGAGGGSAPSLVRIRSSLRSEIRSARLSLSKSRGVAAKSSGSVIAKAPTRAAKAPVEVSLGQDLGERMYRYSHHARPRPHAQWGYF